MVIVKRKGTTREVRSREDDPSHFGAPCSSKVEQWI